MTEIIKTYTSPNRHDYSVVVSPETQPVHLIRHTLPDEDINSRGSIYRSLKSQGLTFENGTFVCDPDQIPAPFTTSAFDSRIKFTEDCDTCIAFLITGFKKNGQ